MLRSVHTPPWPEEVLAAVATGPMAGQGALRVGAARRFRPSFVKSDVRTLLFSAADWAG